MIFVGRHNERRQFLDWLDRDAEGIPRAALVVGSPGRGKSSLLAHLESVANTHSSGHIAQRFTVNENEGASEFLSRILDHTRDVYAGSYVSSTPDDRPRLREFLKSVFRAAGPPGTAVGELLASLVNDKRRAGFERFIDFLAIAAGALRPDQRYIILIDPEKYLHASNIAEWRAVATRHPPRVRVVIAQRPNDVLAADLSVRRCFRTIPADAFLEDLSAEEVAEWYHAERQSGRLALAYSSMTSAQAADLAAAAFRRYQGYPVAHEALLVLFAVQQPADPIAALNAWPSDLTLLMDELFLALSALGNDALSALLTLAIFEMPTPRNNWAIASGLDPIDFTALLNNPKFKAFLRTDAAGHWSPFHPLWAERLLKELRDQPSLNTTIAARAFEHITATLTAGKDSDHFALRAARSIAARTLAAAEFLAFLDDITVRKLALGLLDSVEADADALIASNTEPRIRSVALSFKGDIRLNRGDTPAALTAHGQSLEISKWLASVEHSNNQNQHDLFVSYVKHGDLLRIHGNSSAARAAYSDALSVASRLAQCEPFNTVWHRALAICHCKIGDVLLAQGDTSAAHNAYRKSHAIHEQLALAYPSNTEWQRDLSVSHNNIGKILDVLGDATGALAAYHHSLAISQRLALTNPSNTLWQRDLSICHERIGDCLKNQRNAHAAHLAYGESLATRQRLTQSDPFNTEWQRDCSVAHEKIGDVYFIQGDISAALTSYEESFIVRQRLARADPSNTQCQFDLAIIHERFGAVFMAQGKATEALESYRARRAIIERLAQADTSNTQWQRDLAVSHIKLGIVAAQTNDSAAARDHFTRARATIEPLTRKDPTNAQWRQDLAWVDEQISTLK